MSCLFCKIVAGEIPAEIIYNDDEIMAIRDISPKAPLHLLIIPKLHIETINDTNGKTEFLGKLILRAKELAKEHGVSEAGYRLVFNVNAEGGQEIYHIHLHLLGGRQLTWPPG
ncbi:MAG: histidine triad nucleotide-binding protein [Legionellales bacterium RIFCSPHIGHO2_12_FULL_35_11]|nr:MAG: histidine triad nucleotide-binding protein [Legionellales bacterium RIFCSPHIGHO2_12_FULL_35_11]